MRFTVPTILTLFRMALIPVFVVVFFLPFHWVPPATTAIFALASITDWFDGYLARRLQQTSEFGAFLDPVADKLMITVALVLTMLVHPHWWMALPAMVIIGREITVSALREWMAEMGASHVTAVSFVAKVKTAVQMVAVGTVLYRYPDPLFGLPTFSAGLTLLYLAAGLTFWSMASYMRAAWPRMAERG